MSHKSDLNCHEFDFPLVCMCLSTHTFFPPNKHFTHSTTSHLYVEIHSYTADGPGPCHWRLVPGGLVARTRLSQPWPDHSLRLGTETLLRLLQAGATEISFSPFSHTYPCSLNEVFAQLCICGSQLLSSTVLIIDASVIHPHFTTGETQTLLHGWNSKRFAMEDPGLNSGFFGFQQINNLSK